MEDAILQRLRDIITVAGARRESAPSYNIYQSICTQLDYLYSVALGIEKDRSRLRDIMVGVYAVKEFDESDPDFSIALKDAQYIADKMAKGLKISVAELRR